MDLQPFEYALMMREASDVKRYHTKRTINTQTVGQHSFNAMLLCQQVAPSCRKDVLLAIMHHDLPELITGDTPGPVKHMHPQMAVLLEQIEAGLAPLFAEFNLSPGEQRLIKWCDLMELVLFCLDEMYMGNTNVMPTCETGLRWLWQRPFPAEWGALSQLAADDILVNASHRAIERGVPDNFAPYKLKGE